MSEEELNNYFEALSKEHSYFIQKWFKTQAKPELDEYISHLTNELFEKRRCAKHLSSYEFKNIVDLYLDNYSDWKGGAKND